MSPIPKANPLTVDAAGAEPLFLTAKSRRQAMAGAKAQLYMGIDPGSKGAIVVIQGNRIEGCVGLGGLTTEALWRHLWKYRGCLFCDIEKVTGYIGEAHPGSAMFNFGMGFGKLLMGLESAGINHEQVPPKRWQKGIGMIKNKGESDARWKKRLEHLAQKLFPRQYVHASNADALLIAYYCQRNHREE